MTNERDTRFGGCQCGAIRYKLSQGPLALYVCHCTECRKQSSSAFGVSFIVPQTALHVMQGEPTFWSRPTDTGNTLDCAFCPECGSRLWHQRRGTTDIYTYTYTLSLHDALPICVFGLNELLDLARQRWPTCCRR